MERRRRRTLDLEEQSWPRDLMTGRRHTEVRIRCTAWFNRGL